MTTVAVVNTDPNLPAVQAVQSPAGGATDCHAVAGTVTAASGRASAVSAVSTNSAAPALLARGAGTILDVQKTDGTSMLSVGQDGLGPVTMTALTATTIGGTGDLTITSGDLIAATAGGGLKVKEGTNACMGTGVLNGATEVVIETTAVTANSRIFYSFQAVGGTPLGIIYTFARTPGVSFGVKGAATDTSTFAWLIVEPA